MYHPAAVGEDSILPGGGTRYDGKRWANAYRHRTFSHSTEHAKSIRWREADSLPYKGLGIYLLHGIVTASKNRVSLPQSAFG